eukprot:gene58228-biopygen60036
MAAPKEGVVSKWNPGKGKGDEHDLYVHERDLADGQKQLAVGDRVKFGVSDGDDGRPRARKVTVEAQGCDVPTDGRGPLPAQARAGGGRGGAGKFCTGVVTRSVPEKFCIVTGDETGRTALVRPDDGVFDEGTRLRFRVNNGGRRGKLVACDVSVIGGRAAGGRSSGGGKGGKKSQQQQQQQQPQINHTTLPGSLGSLGSFGMFGATVGMTAVMADAEAQAAQALVAGFRRDAALKACMQMQQPNGP